MLKYIIVLIAGLIITYDVSAQECEGNCCCRDAFGFVPSGIQLGHTHQKNEWMFSYRYMRMSGNGTYSNDHSISNQEVYQHYLMNTDKMEMDMHMIMVMYGLSDKINVMGMADFRSNKMNMVMPANGMNHTGHTIQENNKMTETMNTSGLSQSYAGIIYSISKTERNNIFCSAGFTFPLSRINKTITENGKDQIASYAMQTSFGTGVNASFTFRRAYNSFDLGSQVTGNYYFINGHNYSAGKSGNLTLWINRTVIKNLGASLRINNSFQQRYSGSDKRMAFYRNVSPDYDVKNTGYFMSGIYAGFNFILPGSFKNFLIGAEGGLPVYQYYQGIQTPTKFIFNFNLNYTI